MKTRIFSNWRTSLIGICLLIASLVLVFLNVISFAEFGAFLPTVFGLLYVQDTVLHVRTGGETGQADLSYSLEET